MKLVSAINQIPNGVRLGIAAGIGTIVAFVLSRYTQPSVHWMGAWLAFSVTHLLFAWTTILSCNFQDIRKIAKSQDSGRTLLSLFILFTTGMSLIGILLLYVSAGEKAGVSLMSHVFLTLTSVGTAWSIVHTTFTFKYAHLYYSDGGLEFPKEESPDYMDFVYFSFVIGTTFQVSDVAITSKRMRRTAWIHGLISFAFNSVILALNINVISSLFQNS